MDKLQPILAGLKKYHFWVLCSLILIASTVVWMMAVGKVDAEAAQNQQRIQSALQDAKQVQSVTQHPNDQVVAAYNAETASLKEQVLKVWSDLYKKQRDTVLQWPPALGEKFIEHVDKTPFMGPIPVDYRDLYNNYIKTRWAELPQIIKAKPLTVEATGRSGTTVKTATTPRNAIPDYIVEWDDQERIRKLLFTTGNPTTEWVWVTQEDLWIYETLLNIIKKTNAGAIGPHNAIISSIKSMDVGKTAAEEASGRGQRIATVATDGAPAAAAAGQGDEGGSAGTGMLAGRYVDAAGLPLQTSATADEYKRIPVRLLLSMDAREIPQLILSCANAPLPMEVQQVRVNADNSGGSEAGIKSPDLSAEDRAAGRKSPHVQVALQGVIYIFNPPNREKLKLPVDETTPTTAGEAFDTAGDTSPDSSTIFDEAGTPMPPNNPATATPGAPVESTQPATDPAATPAGEAAPSATPAEAADPAATGEAAPAAGNNVPAAETPATGSVEDLFKE